MEDLEVYTLKSMKIGVLLCLKLTIIFGILFSIIFGQKTIEGIVWSFIISGMYSFGLGLGNGVINKFLSKKWD